jgi:alpha-tubulin suppressor-like RCC1 family protein
MTFGVNNTINCVNQSALRTDLTALELLQLTGSSCQFTNMDEIFSVACDELLPTASDNTGRFVYILNTCQYKFSDGSIWTNDFSSLTSQAYAWGAGSVGRLGNNCTSNRSSPVSVVGGFTDWCQISGGGAFSLAIRTNGTAWGWGAGNAGQLGDNTVTSKLSPVLVEGGFTDWCQVSGGTGHTLGLRTNGTAWAWGCNSTGRLGDNTIVAKSSPVLVVGILNWSSVSAGGDFSLALRADNTAWAWGYNSCGRLGTNNTTDRSSPISVVGGFCDWCQISAGSAHSLAIRQNGTLWAWGFNNAGRLGDNTVAAKSSPVSVVGDFTDWCQVSAGGTFSLAVRTNGTAWGWGRNSFGELGDNNSICTSSPVSVVGGFTDWCQVSAGTSHSLGFRTNSTLWAWGEGASGRLGDNSVVNKSSPVSVIGGFCDWWDISAGADHSLAIRKSCGF